MRTCKFCGNEIPEGRLKALPNATACVKCSTTKPVKGNIVATGPESDLNIELEIISEDQFGVLENLATKRRGKMKSESDE